MAAIVFSALFSLALLLAVVWGTEARSSEFILMPGEDSQEWRELPLLKQEGEGVEYAGTRWAVLIAGSSGYGNYRHQADVCHAYQILKNGGLKDENIVVFMYDDIANNRDNPHKGTIINHPRGPDVYTGVPKDYTGLEVTVQNFFAVLLGDKAAVKGGSGKVVDSQPEDHIFIYYSDHGGPGVLGMPNMPNLFARDLIETLRLKHSAGTYKEMVIYLEACESGSIFEGILPEGLNIYVTTASNAQESSWGTYCPGMDSPPPVEYGTCLGDLYSVAWMEDCEVENLQKETLEDQYLIVKERTSNHNTYRSGSHVMEYGDLKINSDPLVLFLGHDPANVNVSRPDVSRLGIDNGASNSLKGVNQRDADLLHYWHKYEKAPEGSVKKAEARQEMLSIMSRRSHIDESVEMVGELLLGSDAAADLMNAVRTGLSVVDDWECLKDMVRAFERNCGSLRQYGLKHMRSFANFCNAGIVPEKLSKAAAKACASSKYGNDVWAPITSGFSA